MNVLIVGATGDVGSQTAKFAVKKGHRVRALVRPTSKKERLGEAKDQVEFVEGDMLDRTSLERAMDGVDGVVIAIRLTEQEKKRGRTYEDVELNGVKNVVEAAGKKGLKKIILVSAAGVGPHCLSDMYSAKFRSEDAVRNSGIDYTIFQPSGMFKDFDFFHIPTIIKMGKANKWMSPIHFHMSPLSHINLAECMADALTNPKASNKTVEIGGPDCITQGELLNMIAREAGIETEYVEGISKEDLIERVKSNPQSSFFTAEQIMDFFNDKILDYTVVDEMFGIEFQHVGDYLKEAVPRVKAAMAKQGK